MRSVATVGCDEELAERRLKEAERQEDAWVGGGSSKVRGEEQPQAAFAALLKATTELREKQKRVFELRTRRCALEEEIRNRLENIQRRASDTVTQQTNRIRRGVGEERKRDFFEKEHLTRKCQQLLDSESALLALRNSWSERLASQRQALEILSSELRLKRQHVASASVTVRRRELALRCLRTRALQNLLQLFALENHGSERCLRGLPVPPIPVLLNLLQKQRLDAEAIGAALGLLVHFVLLLSRYLDLLPVQKSLSLRGSRSFVVDADANSLPLFVRDPTNPSELSQLHAALLKLASIVEALELERRPWAGESRGAEPEALDVLLVLETLVHKELYGLGKPET